MSYVKATRIKTGAPTATTLVRALLVCGIISSALYVASDMLASWSDPGYSWANQSYSELLAIGSATRPFMLQSSMVYNLLVLACAVGVWIAARDRRVLRITSVLLVAYGLSSLAGPFVPMHERGYGVELTDVLHMVCTVVLVFSALFAMGFGIRALGKRFGAFSAVCLVCVLVFGVLAGMQGARVAEGLPTPGMGIIERGNIYVIMLWVAVLAIAVLRSDPSEVATRRVSERDRGIPIDAMRARELAR